MNSWTITYSEMEAARAMLLLGMANVSTDWDSKRLATEFIVWASALIERITQDRLVLAEKG